VRIRGPQAAAMLVHEIADDGVRFPEHEPIVVDCRHQAVRIPAAILRRVDDPEWAAGVDALVKDGYADPDHLAIGEH